MVKQTNNARLDQITAIISSVVSNNIASSKTIYDSNSTFYQINKNSTNCSNYISTSSSLQYVASSDVLATSSVYQQVVAQIVNQITSSQANKSSGGFGKQNNDLAASIMNIVQTKLTENTLASIGNVANISNTTVQACIDSTGGNNAFFQSEDDIFNYYNQVYTQSSAVQSVSADISNMIANDQGNKSTGLVALIVYAIIAIAILLIVIVCGGMALYLMTML